MTKKLSDGVLQNTDYCPLGECGGCGISLYRPQKFCTLCQLFLERLERVAHHFPNSTMWEKKIHETLVRLRLRNTESSKEDRTK